MTAVVVYVALVIATAGLPTGLWHPPHRGRHRRADRHLLTLTRRTTR